MRFEIGTDGTLLLTDMTEKANDYLCSLKRFAWHEYNHGKEEQWATWFFTKLTEHTTLVTLQENARMEMHEQVKRLVGILEELKVNYGLEVTAAAQVVLDGWKLQIRIAEEQETEQNRIDAARAAQKRAAASLKRAIKDGCKGCRNFRVNRLGDDNEGYCFANEDKPVRLDESPLCFRYGDLADGVQYMGTKFYPQENCEYLKEI